MTRLYTIGNFTIDDIVVWPGGDAWMNQPGGNVLFSGLGARVWMESVGLMARVGSDYPPDRLAEMEGLGFHLALRQVDEPTLHDWALYEANGVRRFINHASSGSNEAMTLNADEIDPAWLDGEAYHIAPMPTPQQKGLVERLTAAGKTISLDPHEWWIERHERMLEEVLARVAFFLPSEIEARLLFGSHQPERAARAFAQLGPSVVVIKMGAKGSLLYERERDRLSYVPCFPASVRDPTGAGDGYCGGFLAGYLLTGDPLSAAQHGTVSASYIVEAIGALAVRQPGPAEALERLATVREQTSC